MLRPHWTKLADEPPHANSRPGQFRATTAVERASYPPNAVVPDSAVDERRPAVAETGYVPVGQHPSGTYMCRPARPPDPCRPTGQPDRDMTRRPGHALGRAGRHPERRRAVQDRV